MFSIIIFDDKKKIHCLLSSLNLIKVLLPELQNYNKMISHDNKNIFYFKKYENYDGQSLGQSVW